jgi:hypothetical protein
MDAQYDADNRLVSFNNTAVTYDNAGNMTELSSTPFTYNLPNQLTNVVVLRSWRLGELLN